MVTKTREGRNAARGELRVRPATRGDAEAIAALATQLGYPSTVVEVSNRLDRILGDASHAVLIAELADRQIAGWVHVRISNLVESEPEAEIGGLVVAEQFRGRGAGRRLMQSAEQWARDRGLRSVYLRSNVIRKGAHAFYGRLGYNLVKTQHAFRKII